MQTALNLPLQKKRELALPRSDIQKDIPFRIIRPKKMAVSDKPNTRAVTRSLVFVITHPCVSVFVGKG
jgi:hypothetical protein